MLMQFLPGPTSHAHSSGNLPAGIFQILVLLRDWFLSELKDKSEHRSPWQLYPRGYSKISCTRQFFSEDRLLTQTTPVAKHWDTRHKKPSGHLLRKKRVLHLGTRARNHDENFACFQ